MENEHSNMESLIQQLSHPLSPLEACIIQQVQPHDIPISGILLSMLGF